LYKIQYTLDKLIRSPTGLALTGEQQPTATTKAASPTIGINPGSCGIRIRLLMRFI
jgi:hypothetical protein